MKKRKATTTKAATTKTQELDWQLYLALTVVILLAIPVMMYLQQSNDPLSQANAATISYPSTSK